MVTGAAGMVGSYILEAYPQEEVFLTDIDTLDVREPEQVKETLEAVKPKLIIHLAAETDVDLCEKDAAHACKSNVDGTRNVALACQRYGIEMVYVSTLGVFDGLNPEPYTESDNPAPVNVYARTKWEGEKIVGKLLQRFYIVRAGWMFGGMEKDKKFVGKIAALCMNGKEIKVVNDKFGNPTYARDLVYNIKLLTEQNRYGLYHMANEGSCSRYEFAQEIAKSLGKEIRMVPVSSDAFPLPAPRPRSEAGQNYKLEQIGLNRMRPWKGALHDYLGSWTRRS